MVFVWAFKLVCLHLWLILMLPLFFTIFHLQRSKDNLGKYSWIFLKHLRNCFEMFVNFVCGFKDKYYLILLKMAAKNSFFMETRAIRDQVGVVTTNIVGAPVNEKVPQFPLYIIEDHFNVRVKMFICLYDRLMVCKHNNFASLTSYVDSFEPCLLTYREGNVLCDKHNRIKTQTCFTNTFKLVKWQ